jgi:hypothetical protein
MSMDCGRSQGLLPARARSAAFEFATWRSKPAVDAYARTPAAVKASLADCDRGPTAVAAGAMPRFAAPLFHAGRFLCMGIDVKH